MDNKRFWGIIEDTYEKSNGDADSQMDLIKDALVQLDPSEIVAFDRCFTKFYIKAYTWPVWGAAYLLGGGCSDDSFDDFRGWLISRGKSFYEAVLADPDSLVDLVVVDEEDGQVEGFAYLAFEAWAERTGNDSDEFPRHDLERPTEPLGEPWEEDDLPAMFPRLNAAIG